MQFEGKQCSDSFFESCRRPLWLEEGSKRICVFWIYTILSNCWASSSIMSSIYYQNKKTKKTSLASPSWELPLCNRQIFSNFVEHKASFSPRYSPWCSISHTSCRSYNKLLIVNRIALDAHGGMKLPSSLEYTWGHYKVKESTQNMLFRVLYKWFGNTNFWPHYLQAWWQLMYGCCVVNTIMFNDYWS